MNRTFDTSLEVGVRVEKENVFVSFLLLSLSLPPPLHLLCPSVLYDTLTHKLTQTGERMYCCTGYFTFMVLDKKGRRLLIPSQVTNLFTLKVVQLTNLPRTHLKVLPVTEEEEAIFEAAEGRRLARLRRANPSSLPVSSLLLSPINKKYVYQRPATCKQAINTLSILLGNNSP